MARDRWWLITSTSYGTWLPGDERGFVGGREPRNITGTRYDADHAALRESSRAALKGEAVRFTGKQAVAVLTQVRETVAHRDWSLAAAAVMADHFHAVVGTTGDPEPDTLLRDLKSSASRRLNREFGKRTWWTGSGSTRKLPDEAAITAAVNYVREQPKCLALHIGEPGA